MVRRCSADVDSVMAAQHDMSYAPLGALFDQDTTSVWLDDWGHVTEAANLIAARRVVTAVLPALGKPARN